MRSKLLIGGLLASVMIIPALAQSNTTAAPAARAETSTPAATHSDMWRSSKLIGGKEVLAACFSVRGPTIAKQPSL
jgi:hypothetical protein